jgi:hypothetical protein
VRKLGTHVYSLSTLLFCGFTGIGIGVGITYWILHVIPRERRLLEESINTNLSSAIQRLINSLLLPVLKEDIDSIIFGKPESPYKEEIRETIKTPLTEDTDKFIKEMERDVEKVEAEYLEKNPDKESEIYPFKSSTVKAIPVWYCFKKKCYRSFPIPINIFNYAIGGFQNSIDKGIVVNMDDTDYRVKYSVGIEKNYCYSIKINNKEKIQN